MEGAITGNTLRMNAASNRHKATYERDPLNFYVDEPGCTEALLGRVKFLGNVLDPFCGSGNIVGTLKSHGFEVYATDITSRIPEQMEIIDWMQFPERAYRIDNIICNPAYGKEIIMPFLAKMLRVARHQVAVLLQAPFLYSLERYVFFERYHRPKLILHFSSRPSMPPGALLEEGVLKAKGGKEDYSWVIFDHTYTGPTMTDWIIIPDAATLKEVEKAARRLEQKLAKANDKIESRSPAVEGEG